MIARINGKIVEKGANYLIVDVNGICYEVFLPAAVSERIDENVTKDGMISLITYHYLQVEPSKSVPMLIGFFNEIEKEFFEIFITVSGIGPRAALKALNKPISLIAQAIDAADIDFLKSLPGIGEQRAREIIAKLQTKIGKFGLIRDQGLEIKEQKIKNIEQEAMAVLMQLQYNKSEAQEMIKKALARQPQLQTTEELLNEVYRQKVHSRK